MGWVRRPFAVLLAFGAAGIAAIAIIFAASSTRPGTAAPSSTASPTFAATPDPTADPTLTATPDPTAAPQHGKHGKGEH